MPKSLRERYVAELKECGALPEDFVDTKVWDDEDGDGPDDDGPDGDGPEGGSPDDGSDGEAEGVETDASDEAEASDETEASDEAEEVEETEDADEADETDEADDDETEDDVEAEYAEGAEAEDVGPDGGASDVEGPVEGPPPPPPGAVPPPDTPERRRAVAAVEGLRRFATVNGNLYPPLADVNLALAQVDPVWSPLDDLEDAVAVCVDTWRAARSAEGVDPDVADPSLFDAWTGGL